jgi:flagellar biosynthetic protein FliR
MISLLANDIVERFYAFLWPMLRISALMATAPFFSQHAFNVRLRILLAICLTWLIYPLHQWPRLDPLSGSGMLEVFNQLMIGATMGLILQVVVSAILVGGQNIATSMGLSMANMIDPNMGQVPVIAQLLLIMSTLVFFGFGGHAILMGLITQSFDTLPIGSSILNQDVLGKVIRWTSMTFLGAVLMSLPVVITLLFINMGLGVMTRAAPSLNIFSLGLPAMIVAGFLVLTLAMGSIGNRIEWLWSQGLMVIQDVLGGSHVR